VLFMHVTVGQKAAAPPGVTVSAPDPTAPGGAFASGTADGKPWQLAVRNIAAAPGTPWCLPAVMFNGRYGNVLYPVTDGAPAFGNPAYLADIPGFPGVGAIFTQVKPSVTRVIATLPGGRSLTVRPVRVSGCGGERFLLAGFAFANAQGVPTMLTVEGHGFAEALGLMRLGVFGPTARGVWANTDKERADIASSRAAQPIGTGTVSGQTWHVRTALGLFGQCYTATLRGGPGGSRGQSADQCVPVAAPPRVVALDPVSIPGAVTQLHGYAGLVNPGTARVVVSISNGANLKIRPVRWTGRAYIAFAVPPGCRVSELSLYDAAGHLFATTATLS
jgi:hypothetical protein